MTTSASTADAPAAPDAGGFHHIPALDGVRGCAILLVLVDHLFWSNNHTGSGLFDFLVRLRGAGFMGVNLFFALSGFLITGILLDTVGTPGFFRNFYSRRALRIFPLYYLSLAALLLLTKPLHFVWNGWQYFFLTYTENLRVWHPTDFNLGSFNINHFWSLQVEEQFYFVWPFLVFRLRRPATLVRCALTGCVLVLIVRIVLLTLRSHPAFSNPYLVYSPTFSCVDNILYGCALRALLHTRRREQALRLAPRVFAACAVLIALIFLHDGGLDPLHKSLSASLGMTVLGIGSAALVAMAIRPASRMQKLLANPTLRFFGRYSYGLYVFHYSITGFTSAPLRAFFNAHHTGKALSVLLTALVIGALSVLAALASFHLVEVHFLRLKRFFSYNRAARRTTGHVAT